MKKKVLFLCIGNSCRSQMAEAIVNARLGGTWEAVRAGTKPAGRLKLADEFRGVDFDLVVTVCDSSIEGYPIWLGKGKRIHPRFPDPAKTDEMDDFRKGRNDIAHGIIALLEAYGN